MEQAPSAPRDSELINAATSTRIQRTFGNTWRERIGVVRGFRIQTGILDGKAVIYDVENLGSVAVENTHVLKASGHTHYFLLLPNERVTCVDVYSTEERIVSPKGLVTMIEPCQINALRFRTNARVSEWFGQHNGTATRLAAPERHVIQALYGSVHYQGYCGQLGVCYAPVRDTSSPTNAGETDDYNLTKIIRGQETSTLCFRVQSDHPRAFVVAGCSSIEDIAVVTEDQYEVFAELDAPSAYTSDHWFVLANDERIEAVGVVFTDGRLVALRFRTNYRTSIWFGLPASSDVVWLDCAGSPEAYICGFHIEGMGTPACTEVTGIAAIYKSRSADEKGEKVAVGLASKAA